MRDQNLKLSEIAPSSAPANFKGAGPQKNIYPHFHPRLAAHHVDKYGEVIPTGFKVVSHNTPNCEPIFAFLLPPTFFEGQPNVWT